MSTRPQIADTREAVTGKIIEARAVAVLRMTDSQKLLGVVDALLKGGLTAIEVTMTVPDALRLVADVSRAFGEAVILGVGSVLDAQTAQQAIDAGARYVVSPVFKVEVLEIAHRNGCPAMPGAFTPTEVLHAQEEGADIVKVFPADVVGMAFFRAVLAPMPHLRMMPTGGVTLDNAGDWIRAGAVAVGVGSALLDKKAIAEGNLTILTENARRLMSNARAA